MNGQDAPIPAGSVLKNCTVYFERYTETADSNVTKKLKVNKMEKTELNRGKALKKQKKNQGSVSGPITNIDVAKLLGMPEVMIKELFGEEAGDSEVNLTGKREYEKGVFYEEADDHE